MRTSSNRGRVTSSASTSRTRSRPRPGGASSRACSATSSPTSLSQERQAAETTLKTWANYVAIDGQLRALQNAGRRADASALDVGTKPGQSNWAFSQFQLALGLTIKINQDAFDAAIRTSEGRINFFTYGALIVAWLVASAAAWYGVHQRLREYEF